MEKWLSWDSLWWAKRNNKESTDCLSSLAMKAAEVDVVLGGGKMLGKVYIVGTL